MSDESDDELLGNTLAKTIFGLMKAGGIGGLPMWTITERPSDFPDAPFVARLHVIRDGKASIPAKRVITCDSIRPLQIAFDKLGLVRIIRSPEDDPVIVETWL